MSSANALPQDIANGLYRQIDAANTAHDVSQDYHQTKAQLFKDFALSISEINAINDELSGRRVGLFSKERFATPLVVLEAGESELGRFYNVGRLSLRHQDYPHGHRPVMIEKTKRKQSTDDLAVHLGTAIPITSAQREKIEQQIARRQTVGTLLTGQLVKVSWQPMLTALNDMNVVRIEYGGVGPDEADAVLNRLQWFDTQRLEVLDAAHNSLTRAHSEMQDEGVAK